MSSQLGDRSDPTVREIKAGLAGVEKTPSTARAATVCVFAIISYLGASVGVLTASSTPVALVFSGLKAFTMAVMFVVAHDACHGGFTISNRLNHIIGRLAFLPTWHPFSCWELGHNRIHHCWTNQKGRDYVWAPFSVDEYTRLQPFQRALQRFYKTIFGFGLYYAIEIWWRHLVFPRPHELAQMRPWIQRSVRAIVALFAVSEVALAIGVSALFGRSAWQLVLLSVVLPHLIWNWLMGLVILLHHTHPKVRWYDSPDEWSFYRAQVGGTVHVIFPKWIGYLLCNIMEHTAHHVEPKIPLYHLRDAQREMESRFAGEVIVTRFRLKDAFEICRRCRLYDFRHRVWLDWDGTPT